MSDAFDPYYTWLAIPPEEQPADLYRLAGTAKYEANIDVISHAVDQRMAFVRTFQSGKNSTHSQKLLNELSNARVTLLNAEKKTAYDQMLRAREPQLTPPPGHFELPPPIELPPAAQLEHAASPYSNPTASGPAAVAVPRAKPRKATKPSAPVVPIILGVIVLLVVAIGGGLWASGLLGKLPMADSGGGTPPPKPVLKPVPPKPVDKPSTSPSQDQPGANTPSVKPSVTPRPVPNQQNQPGNNTRFALRLPASQTLDIPGQDAALALGKTFTVEGWLRANFGEQEQQLWGTYSALADSGQATGWAVVLGEGPDKSPLARLQFASDDSPGNGIAFPRDGKFHHVAVTGNNEHVWLLIDGKGVAKRAVPMNDQLTSGGTLVLGAPTQLASATNYVTDIKALRISAMPRYTGSYEVPQQFANDDQVLALYDFNRPVSKSLTDLSSHKAELALNEAVWLPLARDKGFALIASTAGDPEVEAMAPETSEPLDTDPASDNPFGINVSGNEPGVNTPLPRGTNPPPEGEALQKALAEMRDLLKADIDKARTPAEKQQLAEKLSQLARTTSDDLPMQYVLWEEALKQAAASGHLVLALQAIDDQSQIFANDPWARKVKAIKDVAPFARSAPENRQLAEATLDLANKAATADQSVVADQLYRLAGVAAGKAGDNQFKSQVAEAAKAFAEIKEHADLAERASERLKTEPDNPKANLAYGRYLCFIKDDWKAGLPHLKKGSEAALQTLATAELTEQADANARIALGDQWWDAAQTAKGDDKGYYLARARYWYEQEVDAATGITKTRLSKRIEEAGDKKPKAGVAGKRGRTINLLTLVDPDRDRISGDWRKQDGVLICTQQGNIHRCYAPYIPPEEYDVRVVFSQPAGAGRNDVSMMLPKSNKQVVYCFAGTPCRFRLLCEPANGGPNPTETRTSIRLQPDRRYTAVMQVRNEGVRCFFEGKEVISYRTDFSDMQPDARHRIPDPTRMAIGADDPTAFFSIDVTEVTGTGVMLRTE